MSSQPKAVKRKLSKLDGPIELAGELKSPQSDLCSRCMELRLDDALTDIQVPDSESLPQIDVKIADVGQYYRQQSDSGCILCHLLFSSRITVTQLDRKPKDHEDADELRVFNFAHDNPWVDHFSEARKDLWRGKISFYLSLVPLGFSYEGNRNARRRNGEQKGFLAIRRRDTLQPEIFTPQIVNPFFDLSLACYWLRYCKRHHKRLCFPTNKASTGLLLIDCNSFAVVPAPDQAGYIALSYTWGDGVSDFALSGSSRISLPPTLPNVISSAIKVTMGLGFRYLWVDRYCICQDVESKHQQINQMDLIYQNAELTIVAAAGSGPEYGLSGISPRSRSAHRKCTIGNFDIIPTLTHPHVKIQSSKWATRGWTFQEAALSRRKLVFTDDQVYFECNAMNCHESLSSRLDKLHVKNKSKFRNILRAGLFRRFENQMYGQFDESALNSTHQFLRFMGMVEQYTVRDLTYNMDSLRAFTGIIRHFEASGTGIHQIMGVPFRRGSSEKDTCDYFVDGLGWNHKVTVGDERAHPRRRAGFPSWSWAGWAGEVEYGRSYFGTPFPLQSEVESVFIEADDRLGYDLSTYIDKAKVATSHESIAISTINIQALALPVSAFTYSSSTTPPVLKIFEYSTKLALSTGPWDIPHFYQSLLNTDQRQCIYLGSISDTVVIMVLEARHVNSWSRVGLIFLDEVWYWTFCKSWETLRSGTRVRGKLYRRKDIGEEPKLFRVI